jgi:hypothetical protein
MVRLNRGQWNCRTHQQRGGRSGDCQVPPRQVGSHEDYLPGSSFPPTALPSESAILKYCLDILTNKIQSQLRSQTIKLHLDPKFFIQDATYYHTMHCIDVLRQLITCASDGTLIFKRPEDKFPGEGGIRICKNFDALTQWTREHKYISQPEDSVIDPGAPSK